MRNHHRLLLFFSLLVLLVPSAAYPFGLSLGFRFYGGLHSMSGGDLNSGMAGQSKLYEIQADMAGMSVEGEYQDLRWGYIGGGDLMIHFAPWIGLEIGGGYSLASRESIVSYAGTPDEGQWTVKPSAASLPIRAGFFFLVPFGSGLSLSVHGGAAYTLAAVETFFRVESEFTGMWRQETQKATAEGIGFYGGLGLEIRVAPRFFFMIEAQYRMAELDGFEGDLDISNSVGSTDKRSGTLYHLEVQLPSGISEPSVNLLLTSEQTPTGYGLLDVRPARVDFSGLGIAAGFVIRL